MIINCLCFVFHYFSFMITIIISSMAESWLVCVKERRISAEEEHFIFLVNWENLEVGVCVKLWGGVLKCPFDQKMFSLPQFISQFLHGFWFSFADSLVLDILKPGHRPMVQVNSFMILVMRVSCPLIFGQNGVRINFKLFNFCKHIPVKRVHHSGYRPVHPVMTKISLTAHHPTVRVIVQNVLSGNLKIFLKQILYHLFLFEDCLKRKFGIFFL